MLGLNFVLLTNLTVFLLLKFFNGTNSDCPIDCTCNNSTTHRFCSLGFYFNATSSTCEDINECLANCKYDQSVCSNLIGSFNCSCPKGSFYNLQIRDCAGIPILNSFEASTSIASSFNNSFVNLTNSDCLVDCACLNGSTFVQIQRFCSFGFYFNASLGACQDINECLANCKYDQSICTNFIGSFNCSCPKGSTYNLSIRDCAALPSGYLNSSAAVESSFNSAFLNQSLLSSTVVQSDHLNSQGVISSTVVQSDYLSSLGVESSTVVQSDNLHLFAVVSSTVVKSNYLSSLGVVSATVIQSKHLSSLDVVSLTVVLSDNLNLFAVVSSTVVQSDYLSSLALVFSTVVQSDYFNSQGGVSSTVAQIKLLSSLGVVSSTVIQSDYFNLQDVVSSKVMQSNYLNSQGVVSSTVVQSNYLNSLDMVSSTVVQSKSLSSVGVVPSTVVQSDRLNSQGVFSTIIQSSFSHPFVNQTSTAVLYLNSSTQSVATSTEIESNHLSSLGIVSSTVAQSDHLNSKSVVHLTVIQSSFSYPFVKQTSAYALQINSSVLDVVTSKLIQSSHLSSLGASSLTVIKTGQLNSQSIVSSTIIQSSLSYPVVKQSFCMNETVGSINFTGLYRFPATFVNSYSTQMVSIPCVYSTSIMLNRMCTQRDSSSSPYWSEVNLYMCPPKTETTQLLIKLQLTNVTISNAYQIASDLKNILENGVVTNEYDIYIASNVITNIIKPSSLLSEMITNDVVSSVDMLLGTNTDIIVAADKLFNSSAQILFSLDTLALQQTKNITISKTNLAFSTYFSATLQSLYIYANPVMNNLNLFITDKDLQLSLESVKAFIFLPAQIFNGSTRNVYSYAFKQNYFFKEHLSTNRSVVSWILSATVNGLKVVDSTVPIKMSFSSNTSGKRVCGFWSFESNIWSSDGCYNVKTNQTSYVQCECNHLTNFALILDTDQSANNPLALQIITWIGCSISIAGLFITIICHLLFRKYRTQLAPRILIALSGNLMITLILFLALVERTKPQILCQVVASLIQFFLLSTFCWMVVEGFNLYRMFVKVFHSSASLNGFMLKSFAFAWGIPLIITVTTAAVKPDSLGPATDKDPPICVVRGIVFYYAVLLPICIVILINFVVLIIVQNGIIRCSKLMHGSKSKKRNGFTNVRIAFGFSILLGTTWLFAILAVGSLRDIFQWLFCIFNSLQGLFIFIFYTVRSKEVKGYWSSIFGNKSADTSTRSTLDMITFSETSSKSVSIKSRYSPNIRHP